VNICFGRTFNAIVMRFTRTIVTKGTAKRNATKRICMYMYAVYIFQVEECSNTSKEEKRYRRMSKTDICFR